MNSFSHLMLLRLLKLLPYLTDFAKKQTMACPRMCCPPLPPSLRTTDRRPLPRMPPSYTTTHHFHTLPCRRRAQVAAYLTHRVPPPCLPQLSTSPTVRPVPPPATSISCAVDKLNSSSGTLPTTTLCRRVPNRIYTTRRGNDRDKSGHTTMTTERA